MAVASDATVLRKFKTGFTECTSEVGQYIDCLDGVESGVKQRLINHLNNYIDGIDPVLTFPSSIFPASSYGSMAALRTRLAASEDVNNNNNNNSNHHHHHHSYHQRDNVITTSSGGDNFVINKTNNNNNDNGSNCSNDVVVVPANDDVATLRLIPSRLPSGELALLLPSSSPFSSLFSTTAITDRSHPSAFTAVSKESAAAAATTTGKRSTTPEVSSTSSNEAKVSSSTTATVAEKPETSSALPCSGLSSEETDDYDSGASRLVVDFSLLRKNNPAILKPITVYADPVIQKVRLSDDGHRSPLDFSVKSCCGSLSSAANNSSGGSRKRPLEDLSCNVEQQQPKMKRACKGATKSSEQKIQNLRSAAETTKLIDEDVVVKRDKTVSSNNHDSMWRPW